MPFTNTQNSPVEQNMSSSLRKVDVGSSASAHGGTSKSSIRKGKEKDV